MAYALVISNVIQSVGNLPKSARRLDTQEWVMNLREAPVDLQQECGYFEVVDIIRPDDTPTITFDRTIELLASIPTVVWIERLKTAEELSDDNEDSNTIDLEAKASAAIAANITAISQIPLAVADMQDILDGNANNIAQANVALDTIASTVKKLLNDYSDLLKQVNANHRLTVSQVDSTDGT